MHIIDAHHHIWRQADLPWLMGPMQPRIFGPYESICRDYLIDEYQNEVGESGITQSVYVQANWPTEQFVEEVDWVNASSEATGWPHAIVAYADFTVDDVRPQLDKLAPYTRVRGIRQQLHWHDNAMYRFAARADLAEDTLVQRNIARLADYGWAFDLQVFDQQMPGAAQLALSCPDVTFVLQHAGMLEDLSETGRAHWCKQLEGLAQQPNVVCKLSGLGTFIHQNDASHIRLVVEQAVDCFGASRCLFGSNFPIEKLWTTYADLVNAYQQATAHLPQAEQEAIFSGTAKRVYRL